MKNNKWLSAALASSLLVTGGIISVLSTSNSVNAAAVKSAAVKEGTTTWTVNGTPIALNTIDKSGYKLYSLSQVAGELGAHVASTGSGFELNDSKGLHTVQIQAGATSYLLDGAAQQFTVAPVVHNGKAYVELTKLVTGLGGELQPDTATILSFARPEGEFDTLRWTADGNLIANKSDAETTQLYKFGTTPGNYEFFSSNDGAVGFAVSADQQWGAFTDETGQLKLINLFSGVISPLGKDTNVKTDLVWSPDGKKIYFIQGDKQEKIAQISVDTGTVKTILEDKVENKSELRVSSDEKSVVYIVNVTGVAKNDADSSEDSLTIDYSMAGEQIYRLDITVKDAKPAALTKELDNKLYPEISANGSVVYLSADPEGNAANILKLIGTDGTSSTIALDAEVNWAAGVSGGLIASGLAADGSTVIYNISAAGTRTELFRTAEDVTEVSASHDGSKLAVVSSGKLWLVQNGKALQLSR